MIKLSIQLLGGRGASSGKSDKGHIYGTDYKTLKKSGNIKFIVKNRLDAEELTETMTKGRVYVLMNSKSEPGYVIYFNNELKRNKRIDLSHFHQKMKPHEHNFEERISMNGKKGANNITEQEKRLISKIYNIWYNKGK